MRSTKLLGGRWKRLPLDDRYSRQIRFAPIGEEGQKRLASSRVLLIGLGALGTVAADQMVRAGVGFLRIIDRDFVELSNLQRQSLFDEEDIQKNLPKAIAAEGKLRRVNSSVQIEAKVDDVNPANIEDYIADVDLVLDALDNFETRFVVNDACAKHHKPWIYTAAVGSYGLVMPVIPGTTPCLRCLLGKLPAPGTSATCETAGVIAPITHIIASIQIAEALKFLTGHLDPSEIRLTAYDVWSHRFQRIEIGTESMNTCPVCSTGTFEYLDGNPLRTITLCGRNAVQLIPGVRGDLNFTELSKSIGAFGSVQFNEFLLKCSSPPYEITLFKDGRAIVKGTEEPGLARSVYSKMVGL
jgi:molybdopterin/thiamine biosynthesis adenylyltransferase